MKKDSSHKAFLCVASNYLVHQAIDVLQMGTLHSTSNNDMTLLYFSL
jgi:hypothetical protein